MGRALLIALIVMAGSLAAPAHAQWNNDAEKCSKAETPYKQKIHYCTLAIASGQLSQVNLAHTYFNRGIAFDSHGEYENAIGDFGDAIRLDPNDAVYYMNRALVLLELGEVELALADFDQAATLSPDDPAVYFNRGLIREGIGDKEGGLADFRKAYELAPDDPDVQAKLKELGVIE